MTISEYRCSENSLSSSPKLPVTAFVMTYNEERNIIDCLDSVIDYVDQIIVLDSFSEDKTLEIARKYTTDIYTNKWVNHAVQYQWGMENCDIRNDWVIRLDADERWTQEGFDELKQTILDDKCDGIYVKMKIFFMNKWLKHGGMYPNLFLRVYKRSKGKIESRWMDEHIDVNGKVLVSSIDVIESNYDRQKNLVDWTNKHNIYSTNEALQFLIEKHQLDKLDSIGRLFGNKTQRKRWLKENFYYNLPYFIRPFGYFIYRYFFCLGFIDGYTGFIFHSLHALWYRFLVDAKAYQIEINALQENKNIKESIREHWGIKI